jgi:hypothetical protein
MVLQVAKGNPPVWSYQDSDKQDPLAAVPSHTGAWGSYT